MKFLGATIVYLLIAAVFCWGILEVMHGRFWVLGISFVAYLIAFAKWGCLPPDESH